MNRRPAHTVRAAAGDEWRPLGHLLGAAGALEAAITRSLADPARGHEGRRRLVTDLLTFADGRASARVTAEIADLLGLRRTSAPATPTG